MDTMKLLLGATIALLLGALAVSWQGMKTGVNNTPRDEVSRLEKQIKELRAEQDALKMQRDLQLLRSSTVDTPSNSATDIEAMKFQVAENIEGRKLEAGDVQLRRARMISQALLIGRVKEYVEDAQYGGFVTLDVLMPDQVQAGVTLAIRRKTGLLGQLKVSEVTPEGAIASPMPGFGPAKPQVGDELILPPQY